MKTAWLTAARTLYAAIHTNFQDGTALGLKIAHCEAFHAIQSFSYRGISE